RHAWASSLLVSSPRLPSYLLHPLGLANLFQLDEHGDPWAGHLGIDLAESAFADPPTGTVSHELGAFCLEGIIRNRRALMDPTDVLRRLVFPCDDHANGHNVASVDTFD